jgi:hypothetical protein
LKFYFILQCKRIYRHIDEFGVIPIFGFAVLIAFFIWISNALFEKTWYASYVYISIGLGLSLKLGSVKRNVFLKKCFPSETYWKLRMLENLLFILPFNLFLVYKHCYLEAFLIVIITVGISFINNLEIKSVTIPTPFGKKPFEFVIGFRTTFWLFILFYIITFISVVVGNYNLGIFGLIAVFGICMSYYSKNEPLYYVWIYVMTPKAFLHDKIKTALLFSSILAVPIVVALSSCFPLEKLQITLLFMCLGYCFIILTILGKYHNYPSQVPILQAMAILVSLMFPPLLVIIIPYFYKRAIQNLNSILAC